MPNQETLNLSFMSQRTNAIAIFLSITLIVLGLDLWTKVYAVAVLQIEGTTYPVIDGLFNFTLRYNHGAAFSFLYDAGGWQRWFFASIAAVMSIVLTVWLSRIATTKKLESLGVCLILGGALGNLYDRVTLGYVVDFIDFYWNNSHFPAFNIADCGISCGAALLIWDSIFGAGAKASDNQKTEGSHD
ncbi:signal peptidase II [Marinagarivorans algicola]|uniref:signal peptidase II n=1 Tax=Marinagarivorans algicola TaxID=1513270 RepID=UPI0009E67CFB|nr:signal peptidase II [Marinagarivorans algicola]